MGGMTPTCVCGHVWRVHSLHRVVDAGRSRSIRVGGPCQHSDCYGCPRYTERAA